MKARDIMTVSFQSCNVNTSLIDAFKIFSKYNSNIISIIDEDNILIGVLTKNKLINAISNNYSLTDTIKPFINFSPIYVNPCSSILTTREKLLHHMIGHAPVVNKRKQPIGVISTSQILYGYEKTLDLVQSHLQLLFNSLQFGLLSVDTDMNINAINPLAKEILQFKKEDDDSSLLLNEYTVIKNMIQYVLVNREKPPKNKISLNGYSFVVDCYPLFENKKLMGVMTIIDDLTNIEEIIKELQITKQWEEKLRTLVETAYDAIVLVDENGLITMANKGFCDLFSTAENTIIGQPILKEFPDLGIKDVFDMKIPLSGISKRINSQQCLISNLPILNNGELVGIVSKITFRGLKQLQEAINEASNTEVAPIHKDQKESLGTRYSIADIVGSSHQIKKAKKEAFAASQSRSTVLLIGESGTGKELFAHGIHTASSLPGSFIKVNCAAIPGDLLESEFFGYDEGAFTGAKKGGKKGKFELAQNGTLFLDEIGDMPLNLQSKLLRVLQEKEFEPLGSHKTIKLDIRIVAATNRNLEEMIKEGTFREDLYYRLNILRINIPPLRERKEDINDITDIIFERLNQNGFYIKGITSSALNFIKQYNWPGNIRELQNVLERAANLNISGFINVSELPEYILEHQQHPVKFMIEDSNVIKDNSSLQTTNKRNVPMQEKDLIIKALNQAQGNKSKASKILGISRTWLYSRIRKYNINE
ncbi:sigma-54-dependent Fis family transcriptional regulator [Alkalihalobacterium elongatum]|uniref:sigma-54-dependent Fis family transcriptional regulator n=1 Tax=Alkalihalobacterium elongatum TaxID=2675466 RepID=UPI001C1F32F6|nr:sigma-54-dependent Fis family transcriptional regulator [Alkalihalobacterium elongatum]